MAVLPDKTIAALCKTDKPMIYPYFVESIRRVWISDGFPAMINQALDSDKLGLDEQTLAESARTLTESTRKIISFGMSSYGYDVRIADSFKLFTNINSSVVDPKRLDPKCHIDAEVLKDSDGARYVIIPPNGFLLGRTVEYFHIPRDILVVCLGKSTYARAGAIVNVTPLEPEWHGHVVIEVSNTTNLPLKVYVDEGIAQFLFFRGEEVCDVSYADRGGKYQGQTGVTMPTV